MTLPKKNALLELLDRMTPEDIEPYLRRQRSENLDALRRDLPTIKMSELIVYMTQADMLHVRLNVDEELVTELDLLVAAVLVKDEVDRRLPIGGLA